MHLLPPITRTLYCSMYLSMVSNIKKEEDGDSSLKMKKRYYSTPYSIQQMNILKIYKKNLFLYFIKVHKGRGL